MEKSSQSPSFGQGLELAGIIIKAIASAAKKSKVDFDTVQKIISKPGFIFQDLEGLFTEKSEIKPAILKLISAGEKISIEAQVGKAMIGKTEKTFKSYIDPDFKNWGLNKTGEATAETSVNVYEMVNEGTFVQIFSELSPNLDNLVMSQSQIIRFCEKHPNWLRQDEYATLFLTKVNSEYFVVRVSVGSGGLYVGVGRLEDDRVWGAQGRRRVVAPQLES